MRRSISTRGYPRPLTGQSPTASNNDRTFNPGCAVLHTRQMTYLFRACDLCRPSNHAVKSPSSFCFPRPRKAGDTQEHPDCPPCHLTTCQYEQAAKAYSLLRRPPWFILIYHGRNIYIKSARGRVRNCGVRKQHCEFLDDHYGCLSSLSPLHQQARTCGRTDSSGTCEDRRGRFCAVML
jgi:hypothetical protein